VQQLGALAFQRGGKGVDPGGVPAGPVEAGDDAQPDRIVYTHEHDGYRCRRCFGMQQ
jgi:hypothetical protein